MYRLVYPFIPLYTLSDPSVAIFYDTYPCNAAQRSLVTHVHYICPYITYLRVLNPIMADTNVLNMDENKTESVICKCDLEYASVACNRTPLCLDWGRNGWVAFGACYSVVLCCPEVRRCLKLVYHVHRKLDLFPHYPRRSSFKKTKGRVEFL